MDQCSFKENKAPQGNGGALSLTCDAGAKIKECIFEDNCCMSNKGHNIYYREKAYIKEMVNNQFIGYDNKDDMQNVYLDIDDDE